MTKSSRRFEAFAGWRARSVKAQGSLEVRLLASTTQRTSQNPSRVSDGSQVWKLRAGTSPTMPNAPPSSERPRAAAAGTGGGPWAGGVRQVPLQGSRALHSGTAVQPRPQETRSSPNRVSQASAGGSSAQLHRAILSTETGPCLDTQPSGTGLQSPRFPQVQHTPCASNTATLTRGSGSSGNSCRYKHHPARLTSSKGLCTLPFLNVPCTAQVATMTISTRFPGPRSPGSCPADHAPPLGR